MTDYEKRLLEQIKSKVKELQKINSKDEIKNYLYNNIISNIFLNRSKEFIDNLFIIEQEVQGGNK